MKNIFRFLLISIFLTLYPVQILAQAKSDSTLNPAILGPRTERVNMIDYVQIYYVAAERGSDTEGDGSKNSPWQTIAYALDRISAPSYSGRYAIIVGRGVYHKKTLVMKKYVDLFGGFNEQSWQRDIFTNATILDGLAVRRVVEGANDARIDGFTIRNGLSRTHGAGILCEDTSPIISNNFVVQNMVLEPQDFNNNRIHQTGNHGGGIAALYNGVPVITNNLFFNNKTSIGTGAAIAFLGWVRHKGSPAMKVVNNRLNGGLRANVKNNVIVNNVSGVNDIYRTRSSSGAGISCSFEARPLIQNNMIAVNRAKGNSDAGGIYCEFYSDPHIDANWIVGNTSDDDGGGFYTMKLGQPLLTNNIFAGNRTTGGGVGGIRLSKEGRARIVDNVIVRNPGGGVMCADAYMELENNIIMDNPKSSGLKYVQRYSYFQPSIVRNNIFHGNGTGAIIILENNGPPLKMFANKMKMNLAAHSADAKAEGNVLRISFDTAHYVSKIEIDNPVQNKRLLGSVIRVGDKWSTIKESNASGYIVWGDLSSESLNNLTYEILADYTK